MDHPHSGLVFIVQVPFESVLSEQALWARFEWKITLQNNSWLPEYACRVSCMPTWDGSAMCLQWQAAESCCQQHSWFKSLLSPPALLLGSAQWQLSVLGLWCALMAEFLPAAPEIVPMPVMWAQALPADPCGTKLKHQLHSSFSTISFWLLKRTFWNITNLKLGPFMCRKRSHWE